LQHPGIGALQMIKKNQIQVITTAIDEVDFMSSNSLLGNF